MSHMDYYNLSACLAIDHRTCRRSASSAKGATSLDHELDCSLNNRSCQEENEGRSPCPMLLLETTLQKSKGTRIFGVARMSNGRWWVSLLSGGFPSVSLRPAKTGVPRNTLRPT